MALKIFVKIGGITNLTDARYCSGMYVDLLGFAVEKSDSKFISPSMFSEITGWLSGIQYAAEFTSATASEVIEILQDYPSIKWIEHEQIEVLLELKDTGYALIWKCDLKDISSFSDHLIEKIDRSSIILHLFSKNENLSTEDNETLTLISAKNKIILGGGINVESVNRLIEKLPLFGISLIGGNEIKPGLKDFDALADILEALELED